MSRNNQVNSDERIITYQRVLNLGNYESKRLEISEYLDADEDIEIATSRLMELVERKIREDSQRKIEEEIRAAMARLTELKKQIDETTQEKEISDF
ncbi:hypothetical protein [Calothrix rhizosoleniae]|uniref:hypothetical protein n=1 Tax=Calothrix rhizosoleniae TaxID=888997 RepID=UPI000B4A1106|nr:hypothetical protein [Calothrix rhizosoleniae]